MSFWLFSCLPSAAVAAFSHPAGWHTRSDIVRIRSLVASGREPWKSAADLLLNDTSLTSSYQPSPVSLVCRTLPSTGCCPANQSCPGASCGSMERDAMAAST